MIPAEFLPRISVTQLESARIEGQDVVFFSVQFRGLFGESVEDDLMIPLGLADTAFQKYVCKARYFCPNR